MNHWPEYIDFWHEACLGLGDTDWSNEVPGVTKGYALRGHSFIQVYIAKTLLYGYPNRLSNTCNINKIYSEGLKLSYC